MKKQDTDWKNTCNTYLTIYKGLLKLKNQKTNNPIKNRQNLNRHFTNEDISINTWKGAQHY